MSGGSIDGELWGSERHSKPWLGKLQWAHDVAVAMKVIHDKGFLHRACSCFLVVLVASAAVWLLWSPDQYCAGRPCSYTHGHDSA